MHMSSIQVAITPGEAWVDEDEDDETFMIAIIFSLFLLLLLALSFFFSPSLSLSWSCCRRSGIRDDHEEFEGRATFGFTAYPEETTDGHGHGTHCAGIIGGKTLGVAPFVNLVGVKVGQTA